VDATDVDSWGYFLNLHKVVNARHAIVFTLLGSPERHGQRSQKLSDEEVSSYGLQYNRNWGSYGGKINNVSENFYHKPYFSASHFFTASDRVFLANTVYASIGTGGGKWSESTGKKITSYLNSSGQIDWDAVVADNIHSDAVTLPDGTSLGGYAKNIQSDYLAGHTWAGLKSSLDVSFSDRLKLSAGAHYQYFYSWQNERITDLLGGEFWYSGGLKWAVEAELFPEASFRPGVNVEREDFIYLFYATLGKLGEDTTPRADITGAADYGEISSGNRDSVSWAVAAGLLVGTSGDALTINPHGQVSRAEVCQLLQRYYAANG
jgi:hypothetical protein